MTYEDPQSGRERNLGQDDVGNSTGSLIVGIVFLAAIVFGGWYFYNHSQKVADTTATQPATSSTAQNNPAQSNSAMTPQSSGPGVEGATGGKNGPAVQPENNSSSTGASSGNTGVGGDNTKIDRSTLPSQDSTGVKGAEGNKNGPAENNPANPAPSNGATAPTTP